MAVLPVCRSPTTSSRCPRPTGTIASTARIPDARGSETDFLVTMPGAGASINQRIVPEMRLKCRKTDAPSGPRRHPTSQAPAKSAKRVRVLKASAPRAGHPVARMTKAPMDRLKRESRTTWSTMAAVPAIRSTSPMQACCRPARRRTLAPKYMTTPKRKGEKYCGWSHLYLFAVLRQQGTLASAFLGATRRYCAHRSE